MEVKDVKRTVDALFNEMSKVIVGQQDMVQQLLTGLMTNSHVLMEGYPGLAKTLAIKTLAQVLDLSFSRIQNTPDLMPSDITGTTIIEESSSGRRSFKFRKGPVFANIVLADEINRATPKTQAAMLEAMQERQVTVGNETYELDAPFFVLATQNPIEQEGTYPLPEAQTDRFLLKVLVEYPTVEEELGIVDMYGGDTRIPTLRKVLRKTDLAALQRLTRQVPIKNDLQQYIVKIVNKSRNMKDLIEYGASPRASIGLTLAAKARALLQGRKYVSTEDIKEMAFPVLRHRIIPTFEAEREGLSHDDLIKKLF
ncbi:AAA domain-containing protein [Candidatus Woesearchaeota archaeon]|nr:AAA domain-containing protein [Candidatus Woesearchaeota archaeon]